jgi:hypothetical protein
MSDRDREVFDQWWKSHSVEAREDMCIYSANLGWQAARAHSAPKLTERDAVEVAAKHIAIADCGKWETLPEGDEREVHRGFTCRLYYRYLAKSALRAAGVRFKEEAPSNPEPGASR